MTPMARTGAIAFEMTMISSLCFLISRPRQADEIIADDVLLCTGLKIHLLAMASAPAPIGNRGLTVRGHLYRNLLAVTHRVEAVAGASATAFS
jgi:hypothetical protein